MRRFRLAQTALVAALAVAASGCFLTKALPDPKKKKRIAPAPAEAPPPVATVPEPASVSPRRLMRRLALDLTRRLPPPSDVDSLATDASEFPRIVATYLATPEARAAVAALHARVWRLRSSSLPDLQRYAAADDTELAGISVDGTLKIATRRAILDEPQLRLRYLLDQARPFRELFAGAWTIVDPDLLDLYGLSDDGEPWPTEAYRFATYDDGRPAAGLLSSNGLLASTDSQQSDVPRQRAADLVRRLTCASAAPSTAHTFYDLSADELAGDLNELAATRSPCRGCHAHWHDPARALVGLGSGDDFATWRSYQGDDGASGFWSGRPFAGGGELAALIGDDPRVHRCDVERLAATLLQRPIGANDTQILAEALRDFDAGSQDLLAALHDVLISKEYQMGSVAADADPKFLRASSGVRFLRRDQWQGIVRQLTDGGDALTLPDELDAGTDETVTAADGVPSGAYWYAVDRLARQLATLIVAEELADGRVASTRRLLTTLPDGSGYTAADDAVDQQIIDAWRSLTGEEITDTNARPFTDFVKLWQTVRPDGSEDDFRRAWRLLLVAMLSHPTFITY